MKKLYILAASVLLSATAFAQGNELFISEIDEGAANDKAIEIFNPTTTPVDLLQYTIRRYSNGAGNGQTFTGFVEEEKVKPDAGSSMLAAGDVHVIRALDATAPDILAAANQVSAPNANSGGAGHPNVVQGGGTVFWNGNDAVALVRYYGGLPGTAGATPVIVDIFGEIGFNPGNGSDPAPGWNGDTILTPGDTTWVSSINHSLKRWPSISSGLRTNPSPFRIQTQWNAYSDLYTTGTQSYNDLGLHTYTGPNGTYLGTSKVAEFNNKIELYPNPARDYVRVKLSTDRVSQITILNSVGQSISVQPANAMNQELTLRTGNLKPGMYFVQFASKDGFVIYKELVVQ